MKQYTFRSSEEYLEFLRQKFEELAADQAYNIYAHQIVDYDVERMYCQETSDEIWRAKINGILDKGLNISHYGSICGTTRFLGATRGINLQDLLEYKYDSSRAHNAVCVFALPKHIIVDGQVVEFSSFDGKTACQLPERLQDAYAQQNLAPNRQDYKCSLFDCIKPTYMPKEYFLGVQIQDPETGLITFLDPRSHLVYMGLLYRADFETRVSQRANQTLALYDYDLPRAIVGEYKKEEQFYFDRDEFHL